MAGECIFDSAIAVLTKVDWIPTLTVLGAFAGGGIGSYVQHRLSSKKEAKEKRGDVLFNVYYELMALRGICSGLVTLEFHNFSGEDDRRKEFLRKSEFESDRFKVSDILRKHDDIEETEEIMQALFVEYESHKQRYEALSAVIDKLGGKINPKFLKIAQRIESINLDKIEQQFKKRLSENSQINPSSGANE